ncbi:MAG: hypothetical protein F4Y01_10200, partial [Gammaproteobacteria bacterium]|nr:hypothetical protein [Gammaproteobacteria bacterium]
MKVDAPTPRLDLGRAGAYAMQAGYRAFLPKPLPPDPPLAMNESLLALLSDSDRVLGRLGG